MRLFSLDSKYDMSTVFNCNCNQQVPSTSFLSYSNSEQVVSKQCAWSRNGDALWLDDNHHRPGEKNSHLPLDFLLQSDCLEAEIIYDPSAFSKYWTTCTLVSKFGISEGHLCEVC